MKTILAAVFSAILSFLKSVLDGKARDRANLDLGAAGERERQQAAAAKKKVAVEAQADREPDPGAVIDRLDKGEF